MSIDEAKADLAEIAKSVNRTEEPITLTSVGRPVIDLVPHHARSIVLKRSKAEVIEELDKLRGRLVKSSLDDLKADFRV